MQAFQNGEFVNNFATFAQIKTFMIANNIAHMFIVAGDKQYNVVVRNGRFNKHSA